MRHERQQLAYSNSHVDDRPLVRERTAGLVGVQPDITLVAEAANGRDAIQQFRMHRPEVTLLDLQKSEEMAEWFKAQARKA